MSISRNVSEDLILRWGKLCVKSAIKLYWGKLPLVFKWHTMMVEILKSCKFWQNFEKNQMGCV